MRLNEPVTAAWWQAFSESVKNAPDAPAVESALTALLERAQLSNPRVACDHVAWARRLARCVSGPLAPLEALGELATHDLYLAQACLESNPAALERFEALLQGQRGVLAAMGDAAFVDEVQQMLREKLLVAPARLDGYSGRGNLQTWLKVAALNAAYSARRAQTPEESIDDLAILDVPDLGDWPETALTREELRRRFQRSLTSAMAQLDRRERAVLRQHYLDGLTLEELGRYHGVHRATVARWVAQAKQSLLAHMEGLHSEDVTGVWGLVKSRISLSIRELLETKDH